MAIRKQTNINIKNKKATFDYEIIDTFSAGIVLTGTEIKSIRGTISSVHNRFKLWTLDIFCLCLLFG